MKLLAQLRNPVLPDSIGGGPDPKIAAGGLATGKFITSLIDGMFIFAFVLALIYLITGAIGWITSGGDKANLESARNKIIHAIVGVIVVSATWAVMLLVGGFIGLDIEHLPIPTIGE